MELTTSEELGEGVDLRSEAKAREERTRYPEEDQWPAKTDQPHDVYQHTDAVGDRVLARGPLDVIAHLNRHLGDLKAVIADLDKDLGAGTHPLAADPDRFDSPPPVRPKTALGIGDRKVGSRYCGCGIEDLHPDLPVSRDIRFHTLDEPGPDDDVVALPEFGKEPGNLHRVVLAIGVDNDELFGANLPGGAKYGLQRPAVALVGLVPDDDRAERPGNRDGVVL